MRTLANGPAAAGDQHAAWVGRDDLGRPVASGAYFARRKAGSHEASRLIVRTQ